VEFDLPWAGRVPLPQLPVRPAAGGWLARRRPPTLGEHNDEVLGGELGVSAERLAALAAERVVGTVPH
jgi:crotonobetainyl-CoA:carnitine CoA-transferase CaiB-like acyl-CoA transferase